MSQKAPKVLIIGDELIQSSIPKVRMEMLLGETSCFVLCTRFSTLTEELCKLPSNEVISTVIISCLGTILEYMVTSPGVKSAIDRAMVMLSNLCHDIERVKQGRMRVFIAPCTPRNVIDFGIHSNYAYRKLTEAIEGMKAIRILSWDMHYPQKPDGHLSENSGKLFLEDILKVVRAYLVKKSRSNSNAGTSNPLVRTQSIEDDMRLLVSEEIVVSDNESIMGDHVTTGTVRATSAKAAGSDIVSLKAELKALKDQIKSTETRLESKIEATDNKLETLATDVKNDRIQDVYTFADQAERMDFASNLLKANCVLLTGLRAVDFPSDMPGQNSKTVEIVRALIEKVLGRKEDFSLAVRKGTNRRYAKESSFVILPPVEVRMTTLLASEFRTKGSALSKAKTDGFTHIYFGSCSTLSTRVRIEILRGLCKVLNEKADGNDAYVITNTSRPLLSHGQKGVKGNRRTYLYVEALRKFEDDAKKIDLTEAYKRAKPMYNGRLERTFAILKEEGSGNQAGIFTGGNSEPVGQKRPSESTFGLSPKRHALG